MFLPHGSMDKEPSVAENALGIKPALVIRETVNCFTIYFQHVPSLTDTEHGDLQSLKGPTFRIRTWLLFYMYVFGGIHSLFHIPVYSYPIIHTIFICRLPAIV